MSSGSLLDVAQDRLSRGDHHEAYEALREALAAAEAEGDRFSITEVAQMAMTLASRTKGDEKAQAAELARAASIALKSATNEGSGGSEASENGTMPSQQAGLGGLRKPMALVMVGAVALGGYLIYKHQHSGPADHSAAIQSQINATSCDNSGFYVQSQITGKKQIIYDCMMASGNYKCVTENGGVISDSTTEIKLLFQNTLGGSKPICLG